MKNVHLGALTIVSLAVLMSCAHHKVKGSRHLAASGRVAEVHMVGEQEWLNFDGPWQRASNVPYEKPEEEDKREGNHGWCKYAGMVPVEGKSNGAPAPFCIDRHEYPNIKGQNPMVLVNWDEAKQLCDLQGKRLCTEKEWEFACEGDDKLTYSYSSTYDPTACNNMHTNIPVDWSPNGVGKWADQKRLSTGAAEELERLWQGNLIGSNKKCKSPFGAYDMIGNVDEWTVSSRPVVGKAKWDSALPNGSHPYWSTAHPYKSLLKGGYWGEVKSYCRRYTNIHDEKFVFYQIGFRCCSDK